LAREPGKVTLSGDRQRRSELPLRHAAETIDLKLKALPTFDREKGAIFWEMEVVDAKVAPEKLQFGYSGNLLYLNQSLLPPAASPGGDDASTGEALAKNMPKGEVKPSEIAILTTNSVALQPEFYGN
jgi:hypothetical protein